MSLLLLALVGGREAPSILVSLTGWDGDYYRDIAVVGYLDEIVQVGDRLAHGVGRYAFSPLFPALVAVGRMLGLAARWSQVVVAALGGLAASVGVHLLARQVLGSRRSGYIACALLGALPMAIALQTGYAESLGLAFGSFSLYFALRRNWWLAATLALFAGLARPSGGVVALAIPAAAWTAGRLRSVLQPKVLGATAVGLAGLPLFWLYIWIRTGVPDGWFVVQRVGWHTRFDFGEATLAFVRLRPEVHNNVMAALALATIAAYLLTCWYAARSRLSPALLAVSAAAIVLVLGSSNFWHAKPRLLLAAFPLVVFLARPLARRSTGLVVTVLVLAVGASAWWGAYSLTRWPHSI